MKPLIPGAVPVRFFPAGGSIRYHADMTLKCNADARQWLDADGKVPEKNRDALATLSLQLTSLLPGERPWLLCLGGAPGTGKSTLARLLAYTVQQANEKAGSGLPVQVLSLDDYYLPHAERQILAETIDPRLAQRGVPGTHDQRMLIGHIDALLRGTAEDLYLPVFDKGADDRHPDSRLQKLNSTPACVVLEGWFLGVTPAENGQSPYDLRVRDHLEALNSALLQHTATFWQLDAPDWETVRRWRWQQECDRPEAQRMLRSLAEVDQFLEAFRPLVERQLHDPGTHAELRISLDREHSPHLQCAP